jgi:putative ABC transport system substrate-binding protein
MKKNKPYLPLSLICVAISLALLLVSYACQQKEKHYVIGYVNPNPEEEEGAQGFLRNMPRFGFIEGKNVTYIKFEGKDKKAMEAALKDMAAKHVDLIFTMTDPSTKMARQATEGTNIPVVFILYNAVRSGVVKSLTNPGGNLTGIQLRGSTQKCLEFLLAVVPNAKHILVPVKYDTGGALQSVEELKQGTAKFGLKLTVSEVNAIEDLRAVMSSIPADVDAVFMVHSWLVGSNMDIVIDNAIKHKVPVFSAGHVDYKNGVVLSYGPTDEFTGLQAARLADSILHKGAFPADLPVETADFLLGINLKTAQAMGLEIPNDILQRADFIVRQ